MAQPLNLATRSKRAFMISCQGQRNQRGQRCDAETAGALLLSGKTGILEDRHVALWNRIGSCWGKRSRRRFSPNERATAPQADSRIAPEQASRAAGYAHRSGGQFASSLDRDFCGDPACDHALARPRFRTSFRCQNGKQHLPACSRCRCQEPSISAAAAISATTLPLRRSLRVGSVCSIRTCIVPAAARESGRKRL